MNKYTYLERRSADLHVVGEWDSSESEIYPAGPRRLVIELTGPVPAGITSETLRRANRHLGDMTDEFNEVLHVGGHRIMVRQYAENRLAELPPDGDAYHRGLLAIRDDLAERGETSPDHVLSSAMRVPLETLQACLKVARERLGKRKED
ncbi:hypothetical protein [Actinoplanes sp. L3-i22]|uniref:hypothetical protein n=1 Tax=Actinoplanes sp. L3-i22 TaxID=2836373 RepID=UPI001C75B407|nr:hypothetical protein [Actinoplanes sp. L3-i22]BCY13188.1 hypothetical protein L3i22_082760 [Actinoplanes sp. L3-i22]